VEGYKSVECNSPTSSALRATVDSGTSVQADGYCESITGADLAAFSSNQDLCSSSGASSSVCKKYSWKQGNYGIWKFTSTAGKDFESGVLYVDGVECKRGPVAALQNFVVLGAQIDLYVDGGSGGEVQSPTNEGWAVTTVIPVALTCTDTDWDDGSGSGCSDYLDQSYCAANTVASPDGVLIAEGCCHCPAGQLSTARRLFSDGMQNTNHASLDVIEAEPSLADRVDLKQLALEPSHPHQTLPHKKASHTKAKASHETKTLSARERIFTTLSETSGKQAATLDTEESIPPRLLAESGAQQEKLGAKTGDGGMGILGEHNMVPIPLALCARSDSRSSAIAVLDHLALCLSPLALLWCSLIVRKGLDASCVTAVCLG